MKCTARAILVSCLAASTMLCRAASGAPSDGGAPVTVAYVYGGQGSINVNSWSPDSRTIAFVSNSASFP